MKSVSPLSAFLFTLAFFALPHGPAQAQPPISVPASIPAHVHPLPSLRDQAVEQQAWLEARLDRVLPALMSEYGVDMWILSMREYAEDPVFWSITSPTSFAARRRSIYVFTRQPDGSVERLALGGGSQGDVFEAYRSTRPAPTQDTGELVGDEQWQLLRELIEDRDPANIALNIDPDWAFSDGLHAGERDVLEEALGPYLDRVVREPRLALNYIALRLPEMMPRYRQIMETVHAVISEAFSSAVITPGETTTEDVIWWLRQRVQGLGYQVWFQPSVDVTRQGGGRISGATVIQPGDLLWTDFGVVAMNLHTDTQHLGYVLKPGETEAPAGLQACLADSNRMQELLLEEMEPGRTGNEILASTLARISAEGITGTVYTHPIGDHGHGAGPLIGRWDGQEGVPVRGDAVLLPSTWHSIELQATRAIPEWGGELANCRQEEEAYLDADGQRHWVFRRQEAFHLVR
ncbi:M24 family metallopeptidase [Pseudohongiella sp.]|uniref:Peptidase M24 domain-containing protein n=1 Tax=marine sediment metagenome TaxID=412755 RepID=A0A0F9Z556_9ZZZZ|nr:M24 family metallopeptidase [Pseudohongiella sp.]HDZ07481.1 M24 family metallopeptidase [Pseudohongiella sp.]HEA63014.1 M24 family metallopeptidase [Pseudohongiella sp.]